MTCRSWKRSFASSLGYCGRYRRVGRIGRDVKAANRYIQVKFGSRFPYDVDERFSWKEDPGKEIATELLRMLEASRLFNDSATLREDGSISFDLGEPASMLL